MKSMILSIACTISLWAFSQDTTIFINREKVPLQAVVDLEAWSTLFVGQEYTFVIITSGNYNLRVRAENAEINLIERSKKTTGGLRYTVRPIQSGMCSIEVGNQIDEETRVSLKSQHFRVTEYPMPPIYLNGIRSGEIIASTDDSSKIVCSYPTESGIDEQYPIIKWEVAIGDRTFQGNGDSLSKEVIEYANSVKNEYLHLTVELDENKTGYLKSEGIFILRIN